MASLADIRSKYPEYGYLSDRELADAMHKKFYADMPRDEFDKRVGVTAQEQSKSMTWGEAASTGVTNIPSSALQFGQNIYEAVTNPVDTVTNLAKVGYGGLSKGAGALGVPMDPTAKADREKEFDAVTQFYADRYGGQDAIKNTLAEDPVGMAADLSAVLTGAGAITRAPAVSRAASVVDPVNMAVRSTQAVGRNVIAPVIGMTTGAGGDAVRAAANAGSQGNRAFLDNMRGNAGINDTIDMAHSAMGQIRKERSDAYTAGMQGVRESQTPLNYKPITDSIADAKGKTTFRGVALDETAANTIKEIESKVLEFYTLEKTAPGDMTYRSPAALDALKRAVGEIRQRTQEGTLARTVSSDVYNTIRSEISRQVPEYAKTMKGYSEASDRINDLTKTFSLSERAAPDTTARKLQSVMRNNVNTNYGRRTRLMEELAVHAPDLPAALAGQAMSSKTPRGLNSIAALHGFGGGMAGAAGAAGLAPVSPALMAGFAALPFMSPRLMGEAAYGVGRGSSLLSAAPASIGISPSRIPPWLLAMYEAGAISDAASSEPQSPRRRIAQSLMYPAGAE